MTDAGKDRPTTGTNAPLLQVDDLHVEAGDSSDSDHRGDSDHPAPMVALRGLNLTVEAGETHTILGHRGGSASKLATALMGAPECAVKSGTIKLLGDDVTEWPVDERAKAGMFLAFRDPLRMPGLSIVQLLRPALSARAGAALSTLELRTLTIDWMDRLGMDASHVDRHLNDGCSDIDDKRNEILQLAVLAPELAILDATGTDLDADGRRIVAESIRTVRSDRETMGLIMITHDTRLLAEVAPDHVHLLIDGQIVASGGMELAERLERSGHESFELAGV